MEWRILSWYYNISLKFQRNDRPQTEVTDVNGKLAGPGIGIISVCTPSNSSVSKLRHSTLELVCNGIESS